MASLLQLVNRLRIECGVSALAMTTTANQVGELERLVNWVQSAHMEIESEHQDWQWLRKSASFATIAGQPTYSVGTDIAITDFGMWSQDTFRNYVTATGNISEIFMDPIDYETWRNSYLYGALRTTQSRPLQLAVGPSKQICLGPVPAAGYTVTGDYFRIPRELADDTDEPDFPAQFHMIVVYRAMMMYGAFEAAPEVYERGEKDFKAMMSRLSQDRLPQVVFAGALA